MSREEFLRGLEEALAGEVPVSVVRDNLNYYSSYLSQELAKGRTMEEIIEEIGEPRIVARTIIDSTDAAAEAGDYGAYEDRSSRDGYGNSGYGGYDGGREGYGSGYDGGFRKDGGYSSFGEDPRKRWFLYQKPLSLKRMLIAKLIVVVLCNIILGTWWLSMINGRAWIALLPARAIKNLIQWPVDSILFFLVARALEQAGAFRILGKGKHK